MGVLPAVFSEVENINGNVFSSIYTHQGTHPAAEPAPNNLIMGQLQVHSQSLTEADWEQHRHVLLDDMHSNNAAAAGYCRGDFSRQKEFGLPPDARRGYLKCGDLFGFESKVCQLLFQGFV